MLSLFLSTYVIVIKEIENYYECLKYGAQTCDYEPDVLHHNHSFALFGKVYLKTSMHMIVYFIATS